MSRTLGGTLYFDLVDFSDDVSWVRTPDFQTPYINAERGETSEWLRTLYWSRARPTDPLPERVTDEERAAFAAYAAEAVKTFKDFGPIYELWNEPNLSREWGDRPPSPAEYTELLKVANASIKQADPNAIIAPSPRVFTTVPPDRSTMRRTRSK